VSLGDGRTPAPTLTASDGPELRLDDRPDGDRSGSADVAEPAETGRGPKGSDAPATGGFRADIQGLRAVAVTMVLLYHARLPFVPGGFAGVDVFFVISGFLITGLMVREIERTGRLSLRTFWARRAKRLLPATAVVLVATAIGSVLFLPQLRWTSTAADIVTAALYVINWRLATQSVDYLAQDYAPSPVQHFWSLAVEEQFYVVWPLLMVAVAAVAHRVRWSLRRTLTVALVVLAVPSLIWSVHVSAVLPSAYFTTTTRLWELAVGGGVALLARRCATLPARIALPVSWLGIAVLAGVSLFLPDSVPWPGWMALIPTLATAAVLAAGPAAGPRGAVLLLGRAPMRFVGDLSYSLYLWHWPLVVFATAHWEGLTPTRGLIVVLLSFVPSYLTYRFLEAPVHHSRRLGRHPGRALALGAACTAIGVLAGVGLQVAIPNVKAIPAADRPGAAALLTVPSRAIARDHAASITPDPLKARDDLPDLYARDCQSNYDEAVPVPCVFDPPAGVARTATVYLVGDSRAAQWSPALQELGAQQGWRVITLTKAGCPFSKAVLVKKINGVDTKYTSCTQWNTAVAKILTSGPDRPALVVTSAYWPYVAFVNGKTTTGPAAKEAEIAGVRSSVQEVTAGGVPVVALRETPKMSQDIGECVSAHRNRLTECTTSRKKALTPAHVLQPALAGLPGAAVVDLDSKAICPREQCPVVIGNVLIYRDNHHLTATYARSLAPFLKTALLKLKADGFADGKLDPVLK
jgi:peptidoglycan/LPS O-acetylase OafA/YrhL